MIHVLISYLIGSEAKWPAFRSRRHFRMYIAKWKLNVLKSDRSFSTGLDTGLALFRRQTIVLINVDIVHRRIYTSVGVTESSIMPLYDHDEHTITETDTSSRWLPGLSLGALKLAFSASGDGLGGHPGDISVSLMKSPCIHIYFIQCLTHWGRDKMAIFFADDILKCIFLETPEFQIKLLGNTLLRG